MLVPLRLFIKNNPIGTLDDYTYVISFINWSAYLSWKLILKSLMS